MTTPTAPNAPLYRRISWLLILSMAASLLPAPLTAQDRPMTPAEAARERLRRTTPGTPTPPAGRAATGGGSGTLSSHKNEDGENMYTLQFKDAPLDQLLDYYSELTGRTMIKAPGVNGTFTFSGHTPFTRAEVLQALDAILTQNNFALVPLGNQFFRVVQIDKAPTEGMAILRETQSEEEMESDALVRRLVELKYLDLEDATQLVQAMLHGFGKVQKLERMNSLMILETGANLSRILEVLDMVDRPAEVRVETKIYPILHAKASDIASRLNELVSDSQSKTETPQVASPAPAGARRVPNMIRARQVEEATNAASDNPNALAARLAERLAERGIIQGKVKILTDDRTNIIIVISDPANFAFFNRIVEVLDVPVDPEVIVKVVALEFAKSEDIAGVLNDFIGASKSEKDSSSAATSGTAEGRRTSGARALDEFVQQRAAATARTTQNAGSVTSTDASRIGQLSANTKILSDERTQSLLLMGTPADIAALEDVIKKLDIMLAQVLVEAVILEVNLNNATDYGISWLQKSMTSYNRVNGIKEPVASWGGGFGGATFAENAGDLISRASELGSSGLSYYLTFFDLNIDAVLKMVASSGESRVLATPVVLTTDNEEAHIISGQSIPVRTGDSSYSSGTYYSDYEYKDVGIELTVKPRINPSRHVTLELTQKADTLGDQVDVGNNATMYTINKREMTAVLSVPSRSTIVLGGLVQTDYSAIETRIPILGSIPLIGALFRNDYKNRKRTELLVLITPYVLRTPEEARAETERLHRASNVTAEEWYRGWSDSSLAPLSAEQTKAKQQEAREQAKREKVRKQEAVTTPPPVQILNAPTADADSTGMAPTFMPGESANPITAPYTFDPGSPLALDAPVLQEPTATTPPKRALFNFRRKKVEEPKPSMFAAPATPPDTTEE